MLMWCVIPLFSGKWLCAELILMTKKYDMCDNKKVTDQQIVNKKEEVSLYFKLKFEVIRNF